MIGWTIACALSQPTADDMPTFLARLEEAKASYFAGDLADGLVRLQALQLEAMQTPDAQPWPLVVEALTYLGEIQIKLGDDESAQRVFRYVLERDPETPISPYHHPIDVVFLFNRVREMVLNERSAAQAAQPAPPKTPWHAWMPLGVAQAAQGRPTAAVVMGGTQAALGATAVGVFAHLHRVNRSPIGHPRGWTEDQVVDRVQAQRYAVQWPAAIGFYALWSVSIVDAHGSWRRDHRPQLSVSPTLGDVRGLTLHGTWP